MVEGSAMTGPMMNWVNVRKVSCHHIVSEYLVPANAIAVPSAVEGMAAAIHIIWSAYTSMRFD